MNRRFRSAGFSLVEIIMVAALLVVILGVLANFGRETFRQNYHLQGQILAEQEARTAMKRMIAYLRSANFSNAGAYPIEKAEPYLLSFYSDIDNDGDREKLRYFIDGRRLRRGITEPSGQPVSYPTSTEKISIEIDNLATSSAPIFTFYSENYKGTSTPLAIPLNISQVKLVGIAFQIEPDARRASSSLKFESQVLLRNLKDNY